MWAAVEGWDGDPTRRHRRLPKIIVLRGVSPVDRGVDPLGVSQGAHWGVSQTSKRGNMRGSKSKA